jgi:hypothetical protein
MAELIAEYSPPMPAPVMKRQIANAAKSLQSAVAPVPRTYTPSVTKKRRLRPNRSVSQPNRRAPATAPVRYALAESPTCASVS